MLSAPYGDLITLSDLLPRGPKLLGLTGPKTLLQGTHGEVPERHTGFKSAPPRRLDCALRARVHASPRHKTLNSRINPIHHTPSPTRRPFSSSYCRLITFGTQVQHTFCPQNLSFYLYFIIFAFLYNEYLFVI